MDDTTELSEAEEIRLIEKHSQRIANRFPWMILRAEATGTVSSGSIAWPTRFDHMVENYNYTAMNEYGEGPKVLIGADLTPYKVVSYEDRKRYNNHSGHCYVDPINDTIVFTDSSADGKSYSFDYHTYPATLTATTDTIWIPDRFAPALYHSVCVDDFVIQQSEKARSYRDENLANSQMWVNEMRTWDARLRQMS
jgi:hypothetical protein